MSERGFRAKVDELLADQPPEISQAVASWLTPTTESRIEEIAVARIHDAPWRPEDDPADPNYRALKSSVRASGILQPLLLRPYPDGTFQVVSGARRLRAARETAQATVPALVRNLSDLESLVGGWDAILRVGLTSLERGHLAERLQAAGMSPTEAEALLGTVPWRDAGPARGAVAEPAAAAPAPPAPLARPAPAPIPASPAPPPVTQAVPAPVAQPAAPLPVAALPPVQPAAPAPPPAVQVAPAPPPPAPPAPPAPVPSIAAYLPAPTAPPAPVPSIAAYLPAPTVAAPPPATPPVPAPYPETRLESAAIFDAADVAGSPMSDRPALGLAPPRPLYALPVDPVIFPVGPLEPISVGERTPAAAQAAQPSPPPSLEAAAVQPPPVEAPVTPAEAPQAQPAQYGSVIVLPLPSLENPPASDSGLAEALSVWAPPEDRRVPPPPPALVPQPTPEPTWVAPSAPAPGAFAPAQATEWTPVALDEPVPAFPYTPRGQSPSVGRAVTDPRTVATLGVALAVGAIVFIIVAVLLGAGAGKPLTVAIVIALLGFVLAIVSLALPRHDL